MDDPVAMCQLLVFMLATSLLSLIGIIIWERVRNKER